MMRLESDRSFIIKTQKVCNVLISPEKTPLENTVAHQDRKHYSEEEYMPSVKKGLKGSGRKAKGRETEGHEGRKVRTRNGEV